MKKTLIALALLAATLSACDRHPNQVVYQQPQQPVIVEQQPVVVQQQQPVIVQQQSNTGDLLGAAAVGVIVGHSLSGGYNQPQNNTTIVHKTTVVNNTQAAPSQTVQQVPPAARPVVAAPAPVQTQAYKTPPRPVVTAPAPVVRAPTPAPTQAYKAPARVSSPSSSSFKVKR